MSTNIDLNSLAQKHQLEGEELVFFQRYVAAHEGEMVTILASRAETVPTEKQRLDQERGQFAADLYEMDRSMPSKAVRTAVQEYLQMRIAGV